jgi:hypothetical protein
MLGLSAALLASGAIGARILASDGWLWATAPSHAGGLIGFVAVDLLFAVMLFRSPNLAEAGAVVLAIFQFLAMSSDLTVYSPVGVPAYIFRSYLLGDTLFVALLSIQPAIIVLGILAARRAGPQRAEEEEKAHVSSRGMTL